MQCMVSTNIQLSFGTSPSEPVLIALILRQRSEMLSVCCGLRTSAFDHASSLSLGTGCLSEHPQCGAYNDGTDEEPSHSVSPSPAGRIAGLHRAWSSVSLLSRGSWTYDQYCRSDAAETREQTFQ
jgi:hypothetical protein